MSLLLLSSFLWSRSSTFIGMLLFMHRLDGKHVVFGEVIEGLDIVKTVEAQGSRGGTTKSKIVIEDSGELPLGAGDLRG